MEFGAALASRRMCRNFSDIPVAAADLAAVLGAARTAPSAGNTWALDIVSLSDRAAVRRYWNVALPEARRAEFAWPGLLAAPVLLVPYVRADAYVDRYAEHDKAATGLGGAAADWSVPYWFVDGGAAVMSMLLSAEDRGLGALFFGQFDHEAALRTAFGVPDDRVALGTIALGHAADERPRTGSQRRRPGVESFVHGDRWHNDL
jgi:nitroreductase